MTAETMATIIYTLTDEAEEHLVRLAGGDVRKAADQLGMSRSALYRRIEKYGL